MYKSWIIKIRVHMPGTYSSMLISNVRDFKSQGDITYQLSSRLSLEYFKFEYGACMSVSSHHPTDALLDEFSQQVSRNDKY